MRVNIESLLWASSGLRQIRGHTCGRKESARMVVQEL